MWNDNKNRVERFQNIVTPHISKLFFNWKENNVCKMQFKEQSRSDLYEDSIPGDSKTYSVYK